MKRVVCLLFAVLMLLFVSCEDSSGDAATTTTKKTTTTTTKEPEHPPIPAETVLCLNPGHDSVVTREITGDAARTLVELFSACTLTDETSDSIPRPNYEWIDPNDPKDALNYVSTFYSWVEIGETIYRIDTSDDTVSLVSEYLGEGCILSLPRDFWSVFDGIRWYWPRDTWKGNYKNGALNLSHVYEGETDIFITVEALTLSTETRWGSGTVTVSVMSQTSRTETIDLYCGAGDVIGFGDDETVELKAGESQRVTLEFSGHSTITISAANTQVIIWILD